MLDPYGAVLGLRIVEGSPTSIAFVDEFMPKDTSLHTHELRTSSEEVKDIQESSPHFKSSSVKDLPS